MACSIPPVYWSTAIQWAASSGSKGSPSSCALVYRRKYQEESMKVSRVSVSRSASRPQRGHWVWYQPGLSARARFSGGSTTGSCSSGTGTRPQTLQCTIGIGQPQ